MFLPEVFPGYVVVPEQFHKTSEERSSIVPRWFRWVLLILVTSEW